MPAYRPLTERFGALKGEVHLLGFRGGLPGTPPHRCWFHRHLLSQ